MVVTSPAGKTTPAYTSIVLVTKKKSFITFDASSAGQSDTSGKNPCNLIVYSRPRLLGHFATLREMVNHYCNLQKSRFVK
jgi:hypothetical protein